MIRLAIRLDCAETAASYRRVARRLRSVGVPVDDADVDAIVTDDLDRAREALRAGRHVLLESVFGADPAALVGLGDDRGGAGGPVCMPAHRWRYRPSMRAVWDALDAGHAGEPCLLRIHRWQPADRSEATDATARAEALTAELDLAGWLFGSSPLHVFAIESDGYLQVHLGFSDSGMALIDLAELPAGDGYYSLSLIGSRGAAYADDHRDRHLLYAGGSPTAVGPVPDELDRQGLLGEFAEAIREERTPDVTLDATAAGRAVAQGVALSARAGRVATLRGGTYELD